MSNGLSVNTWFDSYLHDLIRVISGGCQEEFMSAHNTLRQEVLEQHAGVAVIAVLLCEQKSPSMPHTSTQTVPKHRAVSLLMRLMTKERPERHYRIWNCKYPNMENKNNTNLSWNNNSLFWLLVMPNTLAALSWGVWQQDQKPVFVMDLMVSPSAAPPYMNTDIFLLQNSTEEERREHLSWSIYQLFNTILCPMKPPSDRVIQTNIC